MKKFLYPLFFLVFTLAFSSCAGKVNYFDFVSENREKVYLGETSFDGEEVSFKAYAGEKEVPFSSDGKKGELSPYFEVFLFLEKQEKNPLLSWKAGDKTVERELNFDAVKGAYTVSESLEVNEDTLFLSLLIGEQTASFSAENMRKENHLSSERVVELLKEQEKELFSSLTQGGVFLGEISVRFLFSDKAYFYAAVTDETGKITALLFDATTGEALSKKVLNG